MFFLKEIELNNFRCYEKQIFSFSPNINIIVGNNATGKTSLIEAIYTLGMCKSFKASADNEMIFKGKPYFYIKGELKKEDKTDNVVFSLSQEGKKVILNNNNYHNLSDYLGFLNIIAFSPEDMRTIKGEPRLKRKFLDINIGQIDKEYLKYLIIYNKVLKNRNELLKNANLNSNKSLLDVYTKKIIEVAAVIIDKRENFLKEIEPYIQKKIVEISSNSENLKIEYKPNCEKSKLEKEFKEREEIDLNMKTTTCGPHRDDICFILNGLDVGLYASQGQLRTVALALKLGLAEFIKERRENVIMILDDVFGELDEKRQNEIIKTVNNRGQVFITTTSVDNISNNIIKESNIIKIDRVVE